MSAMTAIKTTCGTAIWRSKIGQEALNQCTREIVVDVRDVHGDEIAEWELAEPIVVDDQIRVWLAPVTVRCPGCDSLLEWPQRWEKT